MPHLIPTAVNEQLQSSSNDWSGINLPEYKSCFDEHGFGDWSVLEMPDDLELNPSDYESLKEEDLNEARAIVRLLRPKINSNLSGSFTVYHRARQRADIFIANTGCTSVDFEIDITGVIETYNQFFEVLAMSIDGVAVDFQNTELTHANTGVTITLPQNSLEIYSHFNDQDSNEWGSSVYVPTQTVTIPPSPCPRQLTFWADTVDDDHNMTSLGLVEYEIIIKKSK